MQVPSHKFLPLMYQLAARMDVREQGSTQYFQNALNGLIAQVWVSAGLNCTGNEAFAT